LFEFALSVKGGTVAIALQLTVCSYPKGGTFTTKLDLKNGTSINHKTVFGTRNPAFWVGAVMPSLFFFCRGMFVHCLLSWCVGLVALLDFFALDCAVAKIQMCYQMRWLIR